MKFRRYILLHLLWLLPLAFWPGSTSYDAAKFTVLAVAVSLWLGNAAWMEWRGQTGLSLGKGSLAVLAGLLFLVGAGLFHSTNPTLVIRTCLLISLFAMVTLHTSMQTGGISGQKTLLASVTASAAVAGLYGLAQILHWLPGAPPSSGYPPGISTMGNQNYLAGFLAAALWPALILLRNTSEMKHRLPVMLALVVILTTLALAGATGPQVAAGTALALIIPGIILVKKEQAKWVPAVLLGLLVLVGGSGLWLMLDATSASSGPAHRLLLSNHGAIRHTDWQTAMEMLKTNPVSGVGAGNYLVRWPETRALLEMPGTVPESAPISTRAHNDLFQWLAETGGLGALYMVGMLVFFGLVWRKRFKAQTRNSQVDYLLLTGGLLTVAVHSMVSFPFHLPATSLVFAFLLGLHFLKESPHSTTPDGLGRVHAVVLMIVALVLAAGSLQEFRGDLSTASGRRSFTQGKMDEAIASLEQGVQQMKWSGHGRLYLALAQTATGRTQEAENNFRGSLLDRPSFEAYLALAESAINRGNYDEAEQNLNIVQNCQPHAGFMRQAKFLRGFKLVRQGHLGPAREEFKGLLEEDPNQHRALLALAYIEVQKDRPDLAEKYYRQAMAVIDRQIAQFHKNPGQESAAFLVRLRQNRQVAVRALEALTATP